jgi:REP element-mobilizing transposase RayT
MDPDWSPRWKQRRLRGFDYSDPDHAFFVTICALPGTSPFSDDRLARVVVDALQWLRVNQGAAIYAYCLMPDHLHLLLRLAPGGLTLGDILGAFKRFTTRQSWPLGYRGALWQTRYHDHILRWSEHGESVARYILANPSRKGLEGEDGAYPYSGCPDPM